MGFQKDSYISLNGDPEFLQAYEPCREVKAFIGLSLKSIFQCAFRPLSEATCVGLAGFLLACSLFERTAQDLARLRGYAGSSESLLFEYAITAFSYDAFVLIRY